MRNATRILAAVGAILVALPISESQAQRRRGLVDVSPASERHGFWITLGAGAGFENFRYTNDVPFPPCTGPVGAYQCEDNMQPSFMLALGGTVNPYLRLGGEINGWVWSHNKEGYHVTSYLAGVMLTGQVYPVRQLGAFVKGGVGISKSGEDFYGPDDVGETGFSYLVGAGYEIRLSRSLFLTPMINLMHHRSTNPDDDNDFGAFHERVLTIGVGLTFQPGR